MELRQNRESFVTAKVIHAAGLANFSRFGILAQLFYLVRS